MVNRRNKYLLIVVAGFLVSRILYACAGVQFNMEPLNIFVQYLDPVLLRTKLVESLWYMHSQPPLFNLLLGGVLKVFPSPAAAFQWIWIAAGLCLALTLFLLLRRLGVREWLACVVTLLFIASPACILYENILTYDYLITGLFTGAAYFLHRFVSMRSFWQGFIAFLLIVSAMLMRSLFHPVWLLAVVGAIAWINRREWKMVLSAAAIPFMIVVGLYIKNLLLFGGFFGSSWLGMNLFAITTSMVPVEQRAQLVAERKLSKTALIKDPFASVIVYRDLNYARSYHTGVEALDQEVRSTGYANDNHISLIEVSKVYEKDAVWVIKNMPGLYAASVAKSVVIFFFPASKIWLFEPKPGRPDNRGKIEIVDRVYNLLGGQAIYDSHWELEPAGQRRTIRQFFSTSLLLLIGTPFLIWRGARYLFRTMKDHPADAATLALMLLTIIFVATVGNMLSISENNRYRLPVEPMLIAILLVLLESFISGRKRGKGS